jgi:hypothetical protein
MQKIKHVLGITALALCCQAGAAVTDWGIHDPLERAIGDVEPGRFTDTINFTLTEDTPLAVSIVANNLTQKLDIIGGTISLFQLVPESAAVSLGSYEFGGSSGDTSRLFETGGPGRYFYQVKGYATGTEGGWYTVASTTLVPEPDTSALALGALLVMGAMHKRRNRR